MSKQIRIVLLLLALGFVVYLFSQAIEYYEEETDLGWSREALINPYLAASKFSELNGAEVLAVDSIEKLAIDESLQAIFISNSNNVLSESRLSILLQWIRDGGHLIVAAQPLYDDEDLSPDRVLDYLNVSRYLREKDDDNKAVNVREALNEAYAQQDVAQPDADLSTIEKLTAFEENIDPQEIHTLSFEDDAATLKIYPDTDLRLWHESLNSADESTESHRDQSDKAINPFYWAGDDYGAVFMQIEMDYGLVSILSSPQIFSSDNIDKFDHAYLWEILTRHSDRLAILYGSDMPSLWTLIQSHAPEILLTALMLLIVWVAYHASRFGPAKAIEKVTRRSMLENFNASGHYLWRHNGRKNLLESARQDVIKHAKHRVNGFNDPSNEASITILADKTGIAKQDIVRAFQASNQVSEEAFLRTVRILQQIKVKL